MKLLNAKQVMDMVGVSARSTIYDWMKRGKFPQPVKRWGHPRWDLEQVKQALESAPAERCTVKRG